jgi:hypothetical protein
MNFWSLKYEACSILFIQNIKMYQYIHYMKQKVVVYVWYTKPSNFEIYCTHIIICQKVNSPFGRPKWDIIQSQGEL